MLTVGQPVSLNKPVLWQSASGALYRAWRTAVVVCVVLLPVLVRVSVQAVADEPFAGGEPTAATPSAVVDEEASGVDDGSLTQRLRQQSRTEGSLIQQLSGSNVEPAAVISTTDYEGQLLSWRCEQRGAGTEVQQSQPEDQPEVAARFRLTASAVSEPVLLTARLEPSRLHYDFKAALTADSTAAGLRLALQLLIPGQVDPRTGGPMVVYLPGDALEQSETTQTLRVAVTRKAMESLLRRTRAELNRADIRFQEPLIIGLAVMAESQPGELWMDLGLAEYGPVIAPQQSQLDLIPQSAMDSSTGAERVHVPLDVELGALLLNQQPVVLRLLPDHGEGVDWLSRAGVNTVWQSDVQAVERSQELSAAGFAVLATPPHPEFAAGDFGQVVSTLPPLDQQYPYISGWYLGTRIGQADLPHLLAWSREVRSADRVMQRPHAADLAGAESAASREIDLAGMGRHVVGREDGFGALRNLLVHRLNMSGQMAFPWTWVQAEPSFAQQQWRGDGVQPAVEPEQILQQVYAAISAGYRGVGFWKTKSLQSDDPQSRETSLAIELACLEISLLEPFLARGRREGYLAVRTAAGQAGAAGRGAGAGGMLNLRGESSGVTVAGLEAPRGPDAVVIRGSGATLILATHWDNTAQYVPGPMYEREVNMTVAASETASAWQVSTAGIRSLPRDVRAGGLAIRIENFDRCAAVVVTSDTSIIQKLEQRIRGLSVRAAEVTAELATLKYERVRETVSQLQREHAVPSGTAKLLTAIKSSLGRMQQELRAGDHHESLLQAADALRNLRQLQFLCWKDATAGLCSPAASPHTVAFATLPDHWRLMNRVQAERSRLEDHLRWSATFDDAGSLQRDGWERAAADKTLFSTTTDVIPAGAGGRVLRLAAWPADPTGRSTVRDDVVPLVLTSPAFPVSAGDIVIVRGRVRRGSAVASGSRRPLLLYDTELGPEHGLKQELTSDWQEFEMIRPIRRGREFQLCASVLTQAEVHLDDVQFFRIEAGTPENPVRMIGTSGR